MREVELFRIVHSDQSAECSMFLREKDGGRTFPIMISINEMAEIHRKVHGQATKRPLTHDLIHSIVAAAGLRLEKVVVSELKDDVFYARLHLTDGSRSFDVDARPSDAVALATAKDTPLFVAESILDKIGVVEGGEDEDDDEDDDEDEAGAP